MLSENPVPLWKGAPFLRLVLPLMAGILFQLCLPVSSPVLPFVLLLISFSGLLLFQRQSLIRRFRHQWAGGVCAQLLFFFSGIALAWFAAEPHHPSWYGHHLKEGSTLALRITEPPVEKPKTIKLTARVEKLVNGDTVIPVTGRILLYLTKDSAATALHYGQRLLTVNRAATIRNSGNPGAFDYANYCRLRNIHHQAVLQAGNWKPISGGSDRDLRGALFRYREKFLRILEERIPGGREAALAEALTLGYRDNLDRELLQAYAATGVVHIIAISGIHLGLVYGLLLFLLKPLPAHLPGLRQIKPLLLVAGLWLFALLTGAAPSVLRAALMFTAVIAGQSFFRRPVSVYNTLSASAFLLLCYNPFFLAEPGFQLSYLAVLGIVIFQRPLNRLLRFRYRLPARIGEMACVSIAAQLLTFPLCLYYFHQFPLSFLAANLVAVPLAGIILTGSLLLLGLSPLGAVAAFAGRLLAGVITGMNQAIFSIGSFSFVSLQRISVSPLEMVLIYLFIVLLAVWIFRRSAMAFSGALAVMLALLLSATIADYHAQKQKKIIVYQSGAHTALDFVAGRRALLVAEEALAGDAQFEVYTLQPARTRMGVQTTETALPGFDREGAFIRFHQKRLILHEGPLPPGRPAERFRADILVLSKNPPVSIVRLREWYAFDQVVFASSNPLWKIEQWENECDRVNLRHFSVPVQGAYIADL